MTDTTIKAEDGKPMTQEELAQAISEVVASKDEEVGGEGKPVPRPTTVLDKIRMYEKTMEKYAIRLYTEFGDDKTMKNKYRKFVKYDRAIARYFGLKDKKLSYRKFEAFYNQVIKRYKEIEDQVKRNLQDTYSEEVPTDVDTVKGTEAVIDQSDV